MKKKSWPFIARIVLSVVTILYILNWTMGQEIPSMPSDPIAFFWLSLALLCLIPALLLRAAKWYLIIQPVYDDITLKQALKSYVGALPLTIMTPGRVGELARMLYLKPAPHGTIQGVFLVALDKIMDLGCLLIWASAGAYLFFGIEIAALILLGGFITLSFPIWMQQAKTLAFFPLKLLKVNTEKINFIESDMYKARRVLFISLCGIVCFGIEWLQTYLLIKIWNPEPLQIITVCQVMSIVAMANIIQITIAGIGVRESLAGFWLHKFAGVPAIIGVSSAFLLFVIDLVIPCLVGLKLKTHKELLDNANQRLN